MSDEDPLLKKINQQSINDDDDDNNNEDNRRFSVKTFFDIRRYFNSRNTDNQYQKLDNDDDDARNNDKNELIGIFDLFHFADRIDILLMFITACFLLLHSVCFVANFVITGRLTGIFTVKSFDDSCYYQHQNLSIFNMTKYDCPLGIELNSFNYDRLHKLCRNTDVKLSLTPTISMPIFRSKVMNLIHWLLIVGTFQFIGSAIHFYTWMTTMKRQTSRMSVRLFESLIQRNMFYLDTNPTSQLNSKLFDNIVKIEQGMGLHFLILVATTVEIICTTIVSFIINWQLTLIMLCFIPIVIISSLVFSKITLNETMKELDTYAKAGQIVQEVFSSLRTVFSLNGAKFEQKRYEKELYPTRWSSIRQGAIYGIFVGWLSFISFIVYAVGFIFGSILMSYKNHSIINASDIIVIVVLFAQNMTYLSGNGPYIQSFSQARGAALPVFRLINETKKIHINELDISKDIRSDTNSIDINGDIEFNNVNFVYPSRKDVSVLHNLNFIARVGQTTALVGSSGSGKSTCISLLLRFYELSSGRITINDRTITDYNLKQFRQNIGVVSQEPILFNMSIYENIRFGKLNARRIDIEEAARQANAHNFIMQLPNKYETIVGERGIQLSGGEKQRIALARALIKRPTLLLLDEATSALDNINEKIVQDALDRACQGRTTIVIAHRLSTIQNANQIYVLDNGNIIEQGTHEILMKREGGKYQTMIKSQQIEGLNDDIMNMNKVIEEDEKQIFERSRLLSISQSVEKYKKSSISANRRSVFLRLLEMNSPEWIPILIGCIACLINGAAQPIFAILLAKIVQTLNDCLHSERLRQLLISSFLFLFLGLFILISRFFQYTAFAISGSALVQRIRSKTFACLLRQEVAYFDRTENNSGAISTRLSFEALALEKITGTRLGVLCESFALVLFGLLLGLLYNWQLTMITFIFVLIYFSTYYSIIRIDMRYDQKISLILEQASSLASEVINNMRTIKQLSVENEVLQRYSKSIHQIFILSRKLYISNGVLLAILFGVIPFSSALLYWRALVLVEQNKIKSSDIIMLFAFTVFVFQSIGIVGVLVNDIGASILTAQNFFKLFDRTPIIDNTSTKGKELTNFNGKIEFNQVKFVYPSRPTSIILNKFQLSIKPGQRVALVGSSGCGKSTIIQLLERFYDVTDGQLFLDGVDIRQLNIQWVRSCFGLVSQEPILFDLTIAENIAYGLENVPIEDIINAARKANIHSFIEQLPQSYETTVGMKGNFLSGGEKQRIAIARILLRQPKVLLLDEATSAMDSYNEQVIQRTLEQAQTEDPNRTSLIIAHRLSTIQSCDLICVLDKGYIVESGTHTELIQRRGNYYKMILKDNL